MPGLASIADDHILSSILDAVDGNVLTRDAKADDQDRLAGELTGVPKKILY